MSDKPPSSAPLGRRSLLLRGEQLALATLVLLGLASLAGYWGSRWLGRGRLIDIDHSPALSAQFQLDINRAEWPEFAQLPGIGETLARRIVDERATGGPYADHEDLRLRVQGIGPRTLERIRPYLLPMADAANVAGQQERPAGMGG